MPSMDAVIGNPPYIRYHGFTGEAREKGLRRARGSRQTRRRRARPGPPRLVASPSDLSGSPARPTASRRSPLAGSTPHRGVNRGRWIVQPRMSSDRATARTALITHQHAQRPASSCARSRPRATGSRLSADRAVVGFELGGKH
jgi:hypothetical protein